MSPFGLVVIVPRIGPHGLLASPVKSKSRNQHINRVADKMKDVLGARK